MSRLVRIAQKEGAMNKARTKDEMLRHAVSEVYAEKPSISCEKLINIVRNKGQYFIIRNKLTKGAVANMLGNVRKGIDITANNYINAPKIDKKPLLSKFVENTVEIIKEENENMVKKKKKQRLNAKQGKIIHDNLLSIVKNNPTISYRPAGKLLRQVLQLQKFKDLVTDSSVSDYLVKIHRELAAPVTTSIVEKPPEPASSTMTSSEQIIDSIVWMGNELKRLQAIQKEHDAKVEEFTGIQNELLNRIELLKADCAKLRGEAEKANNRYVELQNSIGHQGS
jgi:hypothetical protein